MYGRAVEICLQQRWHICTEMLGLFYCMYCLGVLGPHTLREYLLAERKNNVQTLVALQTAVFCARRIA